MAVVSMKPVDGLLDAVRQNLPREVPSTGQFDDWTVVAPALVAIASDLFEAIVSAPPPSGRVRAEVLARSLTEYVITFAWIAAAGSDSERAGRLLALLKEEYVEREKAENKLADQIGKRREYQFLFEDETTREGGPLPRTLLEAGTRERLETLKADESIRSLPGTFDMAFVADQRWMDEIDLVAHNPFAVAYFVLFTGPSFVSHPFITAVSRVVIGTSPNLVVGAPVALGVSEMPYGQSLLTFVNMLLVASRALGWPDETFIRQVLERR
jgi:hypothetical protein